ncbi:acetaldehyde dehydrogenase (acetylating) [Streptomyces sp. NPDC048604]|uniref:acetaldehyde dehydrogenase (acetylating) n=1 Tax=Streptomyces sp. NPDC048604 TaxID=3365578 RepID=UPI003714B538
MPRRDVLNVAVLGAGLIGIDLVTKIQRSPALSCGLVVGRNSEARGLRQAASLGCATSAEGVDALTGAEEPFDIVFDATNATAHAEHWARLEPLGTLLIDLTPSRVGHMVIPTVNAADALEHGNVNLISCGGQASVPILHALAQRYTPEYVEVVTTAASPSVGRATRLNLDEYIATTQDAVRTFTGAREVKAIVNLSPARPPATFRVAMSAVLPGAEPEQVRALVREAAEEVRGYAPGYEVKACTVTDDRVFVAVEVSASPGDRIPRYAGNLDIINSAAILIAEQYAASQDRLVGATKEPL